MRRHLALAAAACALLVSAGCSTDKSGEAGSSGTPAASLGVTVPEGKTLGDTVLAGDTKALCSQAVRAGETFGATFAEDAKLLAAAVDKGAKTQAAQKAARDVQNYAYALLDMSKLATDPTLKKTLAAMGAQVTAAKGDLKKIDSAALRAKLDSACGQG